MCGTFLFLTFCFNRSIQTFLQHYPGNYRRSYTLLTGADKILRLKVLCVSKDSGILYEFTWPPTHYSIILLVVEQRNPLLYLKQSAVNKTKRRNKRKNASPAKKGTSPLKRLIPGNSPAKSSPSKTIPLLLKGKEALAGFKVELHLNYTFMHRIYNTFPIVFVVSIWISVRWKMDHLHLLWAIRCLKSYPNALLALSPP